MKIRLVQQDWDKVECDALIVPLFEDDDSNEGIPFSLDERLGGLVSELRESGEWTGKAGEITVLYRPLNLDVPRVVLLGGGKQRQYDPGAIRNLICQAVRRLKGYRIRRVAVFRRSFFSPEEVAQAAVEGVILATFDPDVYKTSAKSRNFVEEVILATNRELDLPRVEAMMEKGRILGEATNLARTLVNEPGNRIGPVSLAERAREIAEKVNVQIEILGEPELEELGMNGILAVARGSDEPARLVVLSHLGAVAGNEPPIVLIGKGVTFDSGGLSLKPASAMEDMKADKAGACAVLAAMQAIAQLSVKRNVVGLLPCAENLPSGRAQRPGDVIRSMSGRTIEVVNTDAEGRLILADALTFARERFNPTCIIDAATLTGACVVALGHYRAGAFSNDESLWKAIEKASEHAGEKLWRMPLDAEYLKELESKVADLKNVGSRWGGAITAAKFLEQFVGDIPWCHLDIAGVDFLQEDDEVYGPTGFGVRTLATFVAEHESAS